MKTNSPPDLTSTYASAVRSSLHEAITRRAQEIHLRNGKITGRDLENWIQAENEILREFSRVHRAAIAINVEGVQYMGEYDCESSDGYTPGEPKPGAPVPVRFDGDKMLVMRRNGRILETRIVNREILNQGDSGPHQTGPRTAL
jgi:hypothetical protein